MLQFTDLVIKFGFFEAYILDAMDSYDEPVRKGTPKGERIGFPKHKYYCSLMVALTDKKLKTIAEENKETHGISYGLLRKWNSEEDFKALVQDHRVLFFSKYISLIESVQKESQINYCQYLDDPDCLAPQHGKISEKDFYLTGVNPTILGLLEVYAGQLLIGFSEASEKNDTLSDNDFLEFVVGNLIIRHINLARGQPDRIADALSLVFAVDGLNRVNEMVQSSGMAAKNKKLTDSAIAMAVNLLKEQLDTIREDLKNRLKTT